MTRPRHPRRPSIVSTEQREGSSGEPALHPVPPASDENDPESVLLRPEEVAEILRIGRTRTFELLGSGELPVLRLGRVVRVPKAELNKWINEHILVRELRQ